MMPAGSDDAWRDETPHVLAALLRRSGDFAACEDAVQEALLAQLANGRWKAFRTPRAAG